jgi:hypothetical protein
MPFIPAAASCGVLRLKKKFTLNPALAVSIPKAIARWVFPTLGGPKNTTFSALWIDFREAISLIEALSIEG